MDSKTTMRHAEIWEKKSSAGNHSKMRTFGEIRGLQKLEERTRDETFMGAEETLGIWRRISLNSKRSQQMRLTSCRCLGVMPALSSAKPEERFCDRLWSFYAHVEWERLEHRRVSLKKSRSSHNSCNGSRGGQTNEESQFPCA